MAGNPSINRPLINLLQAMPTPNGQQAHPIVCPEKMPDDGADPYFSLVYIPHGSRPPTPTETEGRLLYELGNGEWDIPELRMLLEDILPKESVIDAFEV
jgi:hypothetical protein